VLTPTQIADKWKANFTASGQAYTDGINAVQEAPGIKAARASAKWLARVQASVAKYEKNVASVDLATWKTAASTTGAQRLATGATKGAPKMAAFMNVFIPYLQANKSTIDAMDTTTFEAAMQKAYAQALYNHNFPGYR